MILNDCIVDNVELDTVQIHLKIKGMQNGLKLGEKLHHLIGEDVKFDVSKARQHRSLNANAYFYQLCGEIAEAIDSSKDEVHHQMIFRYGQYKRTKDGNLVFCMRPTSEDFMDDPTRHLKPTGKTEMRNGVSYSWYVEMRGSHEYNTQEMAKLIDGVVSECKELGIETLSPDEIKRIEVANG